MNTCKTCERQFKTEPFLSDEIEGLFCSMDCLPEGTLDEPYALSYAYSMEFYVELTEDVAEVDCIEDLEELLDSIDQLAGQCAEYVLGEDGVYFYKDELSRLYSLALDLSESVSN